MNAEALTRCIALAIERIEGGAPPPAKLATDVKRLAKEAGVDVQDAAQSLVATALRSPVVGKAPQAFWSGFRAPIVALATTSHQARDALFALTPDIPTARWLPLLEATGVADEMRSGERGVLEWIRRFVHKESDRWRQHFPAELSAFIRTLPNLQGETLVLHLERKHVELELVDAVLSLGLDVAFTGDCDPLGWLSWQFWLEDERRGDLGHVAASEHASHAAAGLDRITPGTHLEILLAHPGSAQLLHRWAAPRVDHGCTAADFLAEVDRLRPLCLPAHRDEFRDELAGLATLADPAELTALALRDGLLTELTWPALEEAARQLDEAHPDEVTIHESWPWFGVASGNRIIWVTADTSEAPVTVTPPVHSHHDHWQWFRVGGETLCLSWSPEQGAHMTWAGSPGTHHSVPHLLGGDPRHISFETASGRLPGPGLIRPGDSRLRLLHRELVLQEGDAYWCARHPTMRSVAPGTGKLGPESLPPRLASLIEDDLREGFAFMPTSVSHWMSVVPGTEDSLLGARDGQHGWVRLHKGPVLRCRGADGTTWEHENTTGDRRIVPAARIRRPGGGQWLVTLTGHLTRESCRRLLPASARLGDDHLLHRLPVAGWHFLRPRDEAVSARMRAMTSRAVRPLLEALPAWTPEEPHQLPATVVEAAERLLMTSDPDLAVAVGWAALRINRAVQTLLPNHSDATTGRQQRR